MSGERKCVFEIMKMRAVATNDGESGQDHHTIILHHSSNTSPTQQPFTDNFCSYALSRRILYTHQVLPPAVRLREKCLIPVMVKSYTNVGYLTSASSCINHQRNSGETYPKKSLTSPPTTLNITPSTQ
ncbi:hypothetical protein Hamer_G010623 [Homarus americanus]|uniref:Uncharacterized protein n=1 Tax=Homarus americanus TaxID=6706 RepID=A0A8J5J7M3_HOMAM|nr:hypothetical protein Hamer_G010623 [Homarus americanus]